MSVPARIGPYDVLGELGRGGMGVVYRARRADLNREFALKVVAPGALGGDAREAAARLRREAQAAAGLAGHPGIVGVHDLGEIPGADGATPAALWVAMDVVDGGSLDRLIDQGELEPRRAAALVAEAARAVAFAHSRGILHRDLKPANVLLGADGRARIADFGLAIARDAGADVSRLTKSGAIIGTPAYMPPEQARGEGLDVRADVWALGATLYEALAGEPPFAGDTALAVMTRVLKDDPRPLRTRNAQVPRDLDTIVSRCLAKPPDERYPNAEALAEDLERFGRGEPIAARRSGAVDRVLRRVRRNPAAWGGGAAAVASALVLAGVLGVRGAQARAALAADVEKARALLRADPEGALAVLQTVADRAPAWPGLAEARREAETRRGAVALERLALQANGLLEAGRRASGAHAAALAAEQALRARLLPEAWRNPEIYGRTEEAWLQRDADRREQAERARAVDETWAAAESALGAVLVVLAEAPDLAPAVEARGRLAALARARVEDAEARGDARAAGRFLAVLRRYARPEDADFLAGDGWLTLDTTPTGAAVECLRFEDVGGRLEPRPFRDLGATPLTRVPLPMGSYLLVLRAPGRPPLRYPVFVERRQDQVAPEPVPLVAEHQVGAGFRYVPPGWSHLGGDPDASQSGPLRREWLPGFCLAELELTAGEYEEFIDALVADAAADGRPTEAELRAIQLRTPRQWRWANFWWKWDGRRFQRWNPADHPVFGVSYQDAVAYCRWRSERHGRAVRVPSEAEWERAARGADGRAYPWGSGFDARWALCGRHPLNVDGRGLQHPAGAVPDDVSVFGIRDLAGSVTEWCARVADERVGEYPLRGQNRYVLDPALIHSATRSWMLELDVSMTVGFRLAADVLPE